MVDGESPVRDLLTETELVPPPMDCIEVALPKLVVVPYLNHTSVDSPLGLTVPFNVAELDVTLVAEPVVAVGAEPVLPEVVVNVLFAPKVVPPELLVATILK